MSTPRIPDRVLKKVMKNTRVAARNTFDARSMPNHTISSRASAARLGHITDLHRELVPDLVVQPAELDVAMDEEDVARPRDADPVVAHDPARPGAHQDDAIGEPDRLGQIMGHEQHGAARG